MYSTYIEYNVKINILVYNIHKRYYLQ